MFVTKRDNKLVKLHLVIVFAVVLTMTFSSAYPAYGAIFPVDMFYTKFSGEDRVKRAVFTYNDVAGTFSVPAITTIATATDMITATGGPGVGVAGSDGIVGDPNSGSHLLVAGQSTGLIWQIATTGGVTASSSAGQTDAFHLEVPTMASMFVTGIPGTLAAVPLAGTGGTSGAGVPIPIIAGVGGDTLITQVISSPSGFFYTNSGPTGGGSFGTLDFTTTPGSVITTQLFAAVPAAHGGFFDPFTGDILLFGSTFISQFDLGSMTFVGAGLDLSTLLPTMAVAQLDQGAVDGKGHIIVADNEPGGPGNIVFVDYKTFGNINTPDLAAIVFMDLNVDDVAPLIGPGAPNGPEIGGEIIPIDTTMVLLGASETTSYYWLIPLIVAGSVIAIVVSRKF